MIIIGVGCKLKMIMFARRDEKREHKQRKANDRGKALHVTRKNRKRIKNTSSPNDRLVVL